MVWIQGDELHNKFERGPNLHGQDYEAISARQKAEFGMEENGVLLHPRHGSIDRVNLKLSLNHSTFFHYPAAIPP